YTVPPQTATIDRGRGRNDSLISSFDATLWYVASEEPSPVWLRGTALPFPVCENSRRVPRREFRTPRLRAPRSPARSGAGSRGTCSMLHVPECRRRCGRFHWPHPKAATHAFPVCPLLHRPRV